jgi:hypothetical protein
MLLQKMHYSDSYLLVHSLQTLWESDTFQDSAQQDLQISTAITPQNAHHILFILSFRIYVSYITAVLQVVNHTSSSTY